MGITNPPAQSTDPISPSIWKEDKIQLREYQQKIFERAKKENLMVVIPTGLGKTYIAARLGAYFLEESALTKKIVFLAPTRPLLTQHWTSHQGAINLPRESFQMLSGKIPPSKRAVLFTSPEVQFFFMTPQTLRNDLQNGLYTLEDVALVIYDEAHRASGDYAYVPIARIFHEQNPEGRSLALTASPGSRQEKVHAILDYLYIPRDNLEFRDNQDPDVKEYTHKIKKVYVGVDMTEIMMAAYSTITTIKQETTFQYIQLYTRYDPSAPVNEKSYTMYFCVSQIKKLSIKLRLDPENGRPIRILISTNARLIKILHFIDNLEAQGLLILLKNMQKIHGKIRKGTSSKADEFLFRDPRIFDLFNFLTETQENNPERLYHPKMVRLKNIVRAELERRPTSRILIFTKFRDTVGILVKFTKDDVVKPMKFVGQSNKSKTDKGLSQQKQIEILDKFRKGSFNVLCATNVAEEGLDIAECNIVIFYDNSASEIRLIQRMGRTGRSAEGKIVFLYTKGTSDERSLWKGKSKKESMRNRLGGTPLKNNPKKRRKKKVVTPSQDPNYGIPSSRQSHLISSPPLEHDPNSTSVKIHISQDIQSRYQLSNALPVIVSPTEIDQCKYDIAIPSKEPFIGIDLVPVSYISMDITNLSLYRQIARKKQAVPHYLIFVDGSTIDSDMKDGFKKSVMIFKKFTGITATVFKDRSILHLTLRNILTTYLKNNPC
jgi:Fanconi anemia group M protein